MNTLTIEKTSPKTYKAKSSVKRAIVKQFGTKVFEAGSVECFNGNTYYFLSAQDKETKNEYGMVDCPHCGIHLSNGVTTNDYQLDSNLPGLKKFEYMCLACNKEFGPNLEKKAAKTTKAPIVNKSTVLSPCSLVWTIAEKMLGEGARRKDIIEECVNQGVAFYTARTQFQKYKEALNAAK